MKPLYEKKIPDGSLLSTTYSGNPEVALSMRSTCQFPIDSIGSTIPIATKFLAFAERQIIEHAGGETVVQIER